VKKPNWFSILLWILIFLFAFTGKAYAYLDPGTGSYILQMLVAGALGGIFVLKTFWRSIMNFFVNFFSKRGNQKKEDTTPKKSKRNGKK
jgi:hypothetical protein